METNNTGFQITLSVPFVKEAAGNKLCASLKATFPSAVVCVVATLPIGYSPTVKVQGEAHWGQSYRNVRDIVDAQWGRMSLRA